MSDIIKVLFQDILHPKAVYQHWISAPTARNVDATGKTVLITGGNKGIGLCTVTEMARLGVSAIVMCARSEQSMREVCTYIKTTNPNITIDFVTLNLVDEDSIRSAIDSILKLHDHYDVLIGNAGVCIPGYTSDGVDNCMAINHFGNYRFFVSLLNALGNDNLPSRIVMLSSLAHKLLQKDAFEKTRFDNDGRYKTDTKVKELDHYSFSKLANLYFVKSLADRLPQILSHAVHPGVVVSEIQDHNMNRLTLPIWRGLSKVCLRSGRKGCQSTIYAAFSKDSDVITKNGQYFSNCSLSNTSSSALSVSARDKLWKASIAYTGVDLEIV